MCRYGVAEGTLVKVGCLGGRAVTPEVVEADESSPEADTMKPSEADEPLPETDAVESQEADAAQPLAEMGSIPVRMEEDHMELPEAMHVSEAQKPVAADARASVPEDVKSAVSMLKPSADESAQAGLGDAEQAGVSRMEAEAQGGIELAETASRVRSREDESMGEAKKARTDA